MRLAKTEPSDPNSGIGRISYSSLSRKFSRHGSTPISNIAPEEVRQSSAPRRLGSGLFKLLSLPRPVQLLSQSLCANEGRYWDCIQVSYYLCDPILITETLGGVLPAPYVVGACFRDPTEYSHRDARKYPANGWPERVSSHSKSIYRLEGIEKTLRRIEG